MMRISTEMVANGTSKELIRAAEMRARMAARWRRSAGQDDDTIRREILGRFREIIDDDPLTAYVAETVMATARRAIEEVLREGR